MSRYIDADALIKQMKSSPAYNDYEWAMYADGFIEDIESAPHIDIVRCKECRFGQWHEQAEEYICIAHDQDLFDGDHFCSYGEREGE